MLRLVTHATGALLFARVALAQAEARPDPLATRSSPPKPQFASPTSDAAPTAAAPVFAPPSAPSNSELEPLTLQALDAAAGADGTSNEPLSVYGFADFAYRRNLNPSAASLDDSFAVGNFNLYMTSGLGTGWRTLAEARLTYLPNGDTKFTDEGELERIDTTVADYTDLDRPLRLGAIVIERVWIEYTLHPLLTLRAGHWLTPYGIWNVDHGSPVVIGVRRPYIVGEALFPTSQTGLDLYGTYAFYGSQLEYHLTLSNGRGPVDTYRDLDGNKALGARLAAKRLWDTGSATLGVSFYQGKFTDSTLRYVQTGAGFELTRPVLQSYTEQNWALDLKLEQSGFLLQSEGILHEVVYDDDARPTQTGGGRPPGFTPDYRSYGAYGLTGYRTGFLNLMPFAGLEYYRNGNSAIPAAAAFFGGINLRPTPQVVLKAQYTYAWLTAKADVPATRNFSNLDFQVSWSF